MCGYGMTYEAVVNAAELQYVGDIEFKFSASQVALYLHTCGGGGGGGRSRLARLASQISRSVAGAQCATVRHERAQCNLRTATPNTRSLKKPRSQDTHTQTH